MHQIFVLGIKQWQQKTLQELLVTKEKLFNLLVCLNTQSFADEGALRRGALSCALKQQDSGEKCLQAWLRGLLNSHYTPFKQPGGSVCQILFIRVDVMWMVQPLPQVGALVFLLQA